MVEEKPILPALHPGSSLRRVKVDSGDDVVTEKLARRLGVIEEPPRPISKVSTDEVMPLPGEAVGKANLRIDLPEYVDRQIKDMAHKDRVTVTYLILRMISEFRDGIIFVRPEDMVADKRKVDRKTKR